MGWVMSCRVQSLFIVSLALGSHGRRKSLGYNHGTKPVRKKKRKKEKEKEKEIQERRKDRKGLKQ